MSYTHQPDASNRALAVGGVAAIHVLIALGFLAGLAVDYGIENESSLIGVEIPLTPQPEPTPEPSAAAAAPATRPVTAPVPPLPIPRTADIVVQPVGPVVIDLTPAPWPGNEPIALPLPPPPSPTPSFVPAAARPLNGPVGWITNDDYPRAALVREWEGTLSYRLVVDSAGRVTGCSVTQSSGHRALDEAACRLVTRRARFEPASDATGAATGGSYAGVVTWSIPD